MSRRHFDDPRDWDYRESDKDSVEDFQCPPKYPKHYAADKERAYGWDQVQSRNSRGECGPSNRTGEPCFSGDADKESRSQVQRREGDWLRYRPPIDEFEEIARREQDGSRRECEMSRRESEISRRDQDANRGEIEISRRDQEGNRREMEISRRDQDANRREREICRRDQEGNRREREINRRDQEENGREIEICRRDQEGNRREREINRRDQEGNRRECEISRRDQDGSRRDQEGNRREIEISRRDQERNRRECEISRRDQDGSRKERETEMTRRESRDDTELRPRQERKGRQVLLEKDSELRRRGARDCLGPRQRPLRDPEKANPIVPAPTEQKAEPPLPPIPAPIQSPPWAPPDYSVRRREYGLQQYNDQDPRLRAELYPLESNSPRMKQSDEQCRAGVTISPEALAHPVNLRLGDTAQHPQPATRGKETNFDSRATASGRNIPFIQCNIGEWRSESASFKKKQPSYAILKEEENVIPRHASVLLPVLEDSERIFHELVAAGDVAPTRAFLQDHPDFNINCVNYHKISALHVAVKQQNEAMVEFLLEQKNLDISDGALYAIKAGNLKIVEMIFDRIRERSPGLEFAGTTHSVDFADDLTPIILAAQLGNYEIINFLLKRGHTIPPVHPPFCKCEACRADLQKYDRLRYSTMKLNLYKAISNPMYIFQTTDDPFQRAFELVKELEDAATVFPQFKVSFEELWQSLRKFTTELIGCCRNAQEVEIVLKKSPKCVADHVKFPRLQYAIDLKQKEFVSHPYTQAVLGDAWTGELLEWKIRSPLMQSLSVLPRIPMLPIMTVMCILLPNHSLVRRWKTPVNKMISSVASYLIFLIILFLESNLDKQAQKRGPPNSGLEGIIIIYVIGYIWLNIRICFKQGIKRFFSTMWHWYDTIMLFLFAMTIVFWIASWVDITANDDIDLPRKYWNAMDPELIAEGFFAAAVIMAFFRLNLFLSLNYHLGPLQVSIGKMTLDIFRFIVIFFVIILAWCAGLCRFYQPYEGMVQKDTASGNTTTQVPSFVNFLMTLKTFFWAIFGMSPIESADVVIENLPGDTPGTTIINKHQFTEAVGYIAFALFQFLSVVVVLNMLVACMANTFTKVIDNVTVEWVFGRSQIYLSFMASSILPPPFNLLPTGAGLKDMCRWFRLLAKPSDGQKARCSLAHCCYIESETEAYVNNEFPSLMSELAQRYIRFKCEVHEEESNVLEDIRNEINEVKESLRKFTASGYYTKC